MTISNGLVGLFPSCVVTGFPQSCLCLLNWRRGVSCPLRSDLPSAGLRAPSALAMSFSYLFSTGPARDPVVDVEVFPGYIPSPYCDSLRFAGVSIAKGVCYTSPGDELPCHVLRGLPACPSPKAAWLRDGGALTQKISCQQQPAFSP